tara:strand:+ start:2982 stop:3194 length:213 start_codon:yes stop_codon:yes gene_type:complete
MIFAVVVESIVHPMKKSVTTAIARVGFGQQTKTISHRYKGVILADTFNAIRMYGRKYILERSCMNTSNKF